MTGACVPNIGPRGIRHRRLRGAAWLAAGVLAAAVLAARGTPWIWHLGLAVPFALAGIGHFQARERT